MLLVCGEVFCGTRTSLAGISRNIHKARCQLKVVITAPYRMTCMQGYVEAPDCSAGPVGLVLFGFVGTCALHFVQEIECRAPPWWSLKV